MADSTAELKARARQVGEERDRVEAEIATISARLQAPGQPGLKGSLLDGQVWKARKRERESNFLKHEEKHGREARKREHGRARKH